MALPTSTTRRSTSVSYEVAGMRNRFYLGDESDWHPYVDRDGAPGFVSVVDVEAEEDAVNVFISWHKARKDGTAGVRSVELVGDPDRLPPWVADEVARMKRRASTITAAIAQVLDKLEQGAPA